ncbi:fatty acid desaturase [Prochlorococcus sp. MIT 1307]|uniref:fatty acid desaturase n=1 Tax=Prochlorococcus sp. MIT 1307 TaxID=3096219 RepID=UPI002A74880F|nr:fatty acid desaturase [Prochlorococcus sp. MIT 1307]
MVKLNNAKSLTYQQLDKVPSKPEVQELSRSDFDIKPYLRRSNIRASWQLFTTIAPVAGLWWVVARINQASISISFKGLAILPILILLALFSSRAFSLMHDCGHRSLFRSLWLNKTMAFFLGVLNAIPQKPWSLDHAFHHRHNGNWEIYRGPIDVITLTDYQKLSEINKFLYAFSRHWLMLFPGGFYYLVIKPRLTLIQVTLSFLWSIIEDFIGCLLKKDFANIFVFSGRFRSKNSGYGDTFVEIADLYANNFAVIIIWILMSRWLGAGLFWSCYSVVMTFSAAIFICIFFVQHNFKDSYAHGSYNWSSLLGAVEGSSNLEIPRCLNWFFADISFHSIHHLCDRIPNYHLRACHERNKHLLVNAKIITLTEIPHCFDYILWDSDLQRLTTIEKAKSSC